MAAHLAGAVAANTTLPVVGIPMKGGAMDGLDALLATVQMPSGIPVATVALNGAKNAAVLAEDLIGYGFDIVSGGTDNHSMLLDLRPKYPELTGKVAEAALVAADITANKNAVPYDERSAFQTSGLRLGTAAMTTRGAKEDMMHLVAELINEVLADPENEQVIARVREKVNATMKDYPLFAY